MHLMGTNQARFWHTLAMACPSSHHLDLFHHNLDIPWTTPMPCANPRSPRGQLTQQPQIKERIAANERSEPITSVIEARDSNGNSITTTTVTTASTSVTTEVHYQPLSGQVYYLVNVKSGTTLSLSAADNRSIVGSIHRGLDEQVCVLEGAWVLTKQFRSGE